MGARYYDANVGRFLSQEPVFLAVGTDLKKYGITQAQLLVDPQQLNSYSYARNNPLVYTDPKGEFAFLVPLMVMYGPVAIPAAITATSVVAATVSSILVGGQIYAYTHNQGAVGDQLGEANMSVLLGAATVAEGGDWQQQECLV